MKIRFYVAPETGAPHIHNHEVDEDEIAEVLLTPGEDRGGRDGSRVAIGRTRSGRYLIYVPDPQAASVFVITAYEVAGKALLAYRRRRKREGKR